MKNCTVFRCVISMLFAFATLIVSGRSVVQKKVQVGNLCYSVYDDLTADVVWSSDYTSLTVVDIPDRITVEGTEYVVTGIGASSFYRCINLGDVTIPSTVTNIGYEAFSLCTSLLRVVVPPSVTSIGGYAFRGCYGLVDLSLPNSVTSIGEYAFADCVGITSINIPNKLTGIAKNTFNYCSGLQSVVIPSSVTSISYGAFAYCYNLVSVTLPMSLTSIGESVFYGCIRLPNITIPSSVTSIGETVFQNCSKLLSIDVDEANPAYKSIDGVLYSKDETVLYCFPSGRLEGNYDVPNTVTTYGKSAFAGCTSLASVTLSEESLSIPDELFRNCYNIAEIKIPEKVTRIGMSAFSGCGGLSSIRIPKSVTYIDMSAFFRCGAMKSIVFDGSCQFSFCVFDYCPVERVYLPSDDNLKRVKSSSTWSSDTEFITSETVTIDSEIGYSTFFYPYAVDVPSGLSAYVGHIENNLLKLEAVKGTIPPSTAVVFRGKGSATLSASENNPAAVSDNDLKGLLVDTDVDDAETDAETDVVLYTLRVENGRVGFYPFAEGCLTACNGYLSISSGIDVMAADLIYMSGNDMMDAIDVVEQDVVEAGETPIYDLLGRRVSADVLRPGLYVSGRKKIYVRK